MAKETLLSIYDTLEQKFIFTAIERSVVMDMYGISSHAVSQSIAMGYKVENRYLIAKVIDGKSTIIIPKWFKEWDEIAKTINAKLKKVNRERLVIK